MSDKESRRSRILVVGQTPPPFGGQAIMIQRMLDHDYEGVELRHVRMAFSHEISEAGRFQLRKLLHLVSVILRIAWARWRYRTPTLYYPPAGPNRVPVFRDIAILLSTRWMFRTTIFHFHATGLPLIYPELTPFMQRLFRTAYWAPDLAIVTSENSLLDAEGLEAQRVLVVPNCLDSPASPERLRAQRPGEPCRLLYVGLVTPTKGVGEFLEAGALLRDRGVNAELVIAGRLVDEAYSGHLLNTIGRLNLEDRVTITGELDRLAVEREYQRADVFVFPTHARSESFGIVLLEAMSFALPLVGSGEAGVRSIIRNGVNGFHVASRDVVALADSLETLIADPDLARRMGAAGRELVQTEYSPDRFFQSMHRAFVSVAQEGCVDPHTAPRP